MFEFPSGQTVVTDKVEHGTKSDAQTFVGEAQHERMSAEFMQQTSGLRGSIPTAGSMALASSGAFPALGNDDSLSFGASSSLPSMMGNIEDVMPDEVWSQVWNKVQTVGSLTPEQTSSTQKCAKPTQLKT